MAFTQDFRTQRRNYEDGDTRIGEKDRLWYDSVTNTIRISDGETPGGIAVSGGSGGGSYTLPTATTTVKGGVKIDGTTITINNQVISGFSGSYTDLSNKPTIPSNTNQLTNGAGYITSASLPTAVSQLSNDTGFLTTSNFDLDTIDLDANNKLKATGILPGDTEGFTAVFAGRAAGVAALPNTVIQSQAEVNDYAQNNFQNTYDGNHASTEWVATSPNGDDSNYYIDFGISGASWDGTAANSLYTNAGQRDGWVYVQGGNAGGGNLILGTSLASTYTKIIAGNASAGNTEVARFSSTEVKLKKQLTFNDNTTQTTAWTGTVDWADVTNTPTIITTLGSLDDVLTSGVTDGQVLKYNATAGKWQPAADLVGSGGSGIGLADLSASNNSASGGGSLSYNNTTGVFTFTPPDLSTYVTTSSLSSTLTSYATTSYVTSQGYITSAGNAATATRLGTARTINNVSFDGSASITVTANTTNALTIGTGLSGTSFNGSTGVTIAVDNTVALRADTHYIGTTSIALNRSSASQTLTGVSIDGNAATVTNGVYTTGSYSNPAWITSLAYSKISGAPSIPVNVSQLTNDSGYITAAAIPAQFTFNVAADDSTMVAIGTEETVKFIGSTGIDTSSNAEGAITIAVDSTVVRTSDTGKVTNAMLEGNIANAKLFNSTVTIGSTVVALGTTTANLEGLNSVTATNFIGNATTVTNGVYTNSIGVVTDIMLAGSIANNKLTNSSITVNGTSISLGSSATITAANPNALTIGTGLSGTSYTGGSAVTIALATGYGDTQNPYASKTANYVLAAPNGSSGAPTFRAIVAADIPTLNQNTTGSAATLTTARNINGVSFNGSADITVTAAAGTLTGTELNSSVVTSSLTSVGTLTGLTVTSTSSSNSNVVSITGVTSPANGSTATWNFQTEGTSIGSYGSRIRFPDGSYQYTAYTGNATTATTLQTARNINGVSFNGSADITVTAAAGTLTGTTLNSTVVTSSLTSVGTLTSLSSGAITTTGTLALNASGGITTNQTTFPLVNTTATTVNFAGAATAVNIGASTGTTTVNNMFKVNYTGSTDSSLQIAGNNTKGGAGYHDFLKVTNTGQTNPNKYFRLTSTGTLQILNSAYSANIFSVTDTGFIAINASTNTTNGVPVNNAIEMNTNSYIYDDGNYHLTAKTGNIWLNSNNGGAVSINQQVPSGTAAGGLAVTGPVNAQTGYYARTAWNSAIDTEITVDDYRFRISNQGGIFPQVISNTSGTKNSAWTVVAARSGSAITQTGSTGTLVANNAWTSLYTSGGMDSAGDTYVATLQDKTQGRIYRVTFMRSDNGSTTGYNIIAERLL